MPAPTEQHVLVSPPGLAGLLRQPARPCGLTLLFHRTAAGRSRRRNARIAGVLNDYGLATLCVCVQPDGEDHKHTPQHGHIHAGVMAQRMADAVAWARQQPGLRALGLALLGSCIPANASVLAVSKLRVPAQAVVLLSGELDEVAEHLPQVQAPALLIVGGRDERALPHNRRAVRMLSGRRRLEIVPEAGHRFEEPGALDTVAHVTGDWLSRGLAHAG